jgi:hypothetical protein
MKPKILYLTTGKKRFNQLEFEDRTHLIYSGYCGDELRMATGGCIISAACFNYIPSDMELLFVLSRVRRTPVNIGWRTCYPLGVWLSATHGLCFTRNLEERLTAHSQ